MWSTALDDNDHDGLSNQFEVNRPSDWLDGCDLTDRLVNPWAYTNPFNPCKPFNSERCHSHPPFGYYKSDVVPSVGPNPPAGYPDVASGDAGQLIPPPSISGGPRAAGGAQDWWSEAGVGKSGVVRGGSGVEQAIRMAYPRHHRDDRRQRADADGKT